jgi:hypothetical protein
MKKLALRIVGSLLIIFIMFKFVEKFLGITKEKEMDLVKLLADLVGAIGAIDALKGQLADAQASADALAKLKFDEGYSKGFEDGVASAPKSDKIYSQEEADALIKAVVDPLTAQVADLQVKMDAMKVEGEAAVEAAKAQVKAEIKASLDQFEADKLG